MPPAGLESDTPDVRHEHSDGRAPPSRWQRPGATAAEEERLRGRRDALFVDGVIGVPQENIGEAGLQEVHGEEGGLLHNLARKQTQRGTYLHAF